MPSPPWVWTDLRARRPHDYGDVTEVSVDAALERYATVDRTGMVVVRRLDDDRELVRLPGPDGRDFAYRVAIFSPDGELLVAAYHLNRGKDNLLRVWHLGRRELIASLPSRGVWRSTGRTPPAVLCQGGGHRRLGPRRAPGRPAAAAGLQADGSGARSRRPAARREQLRSGCKGSGGAAGRDPRSRNRPRTGGLEFAGRQGAMAWSADGQLLAVGGGRADPRVYVWKRPPRGSGLRASGTHHDIIRAQFAHSGYLLRPQAGTTRPASGTRPRESPWRWRVVTYKARSRRTIAGWPSLWVGRSASGT